MRLRDGRQKGLNGMTERSRIRRHADRAVPARVDEILRAGRVAHVAYVLDGQPYVLPFTYDYEDGTLYLHGSFASRTLKTLRSGTPVCVEVMMLDGLVASRDALNHSMNYRSAVVFGVAKPVKDEADKRAIFERMTRRYFAGRTAGQDYEHASIKDLRSTDLLVVRIEEMSAKSRSGPPMGERDADPEAAGSAFVVELPGVDG